MDKEPGSSAVEPKVEPKAEEPKVEPEKKPEGEPTVPYKDFQNLQSVYDQQVAAKNKEIDRLTKATEDAVAEATQAKEGLPTDALARIKAEGDIKKREGVLVGREETLTKRAMQVKARELLAEHKVEMTVDDLVKMDNETEMELAVLRKKVTVPAEVKLPGKDQIDTGPGRSVSPVSESEKLQEAISKVMK